MSKSGLRTIILEFSTIERLPVEIETICEAIIEKGFQDKILVDGRKSDPGLIRGVFYQYTVKATPYSQPDLCTIVGYNTSLPTEWQRVACCKELMHIFDDDVEKTSAKEEVVGLIDKLLGPMSTDDLGVADIMAMKDKFALYECLPLLLPEAAREKCLSAIAAGKATPAKIAELACLPLHLCRVVLSDEWPKLLATILEC